MTHDRSQRTIVQKFKGIGTSDGAGVKLTRIIGSPDINMLDPFLLLDCFESDDANDYIGGFPEHPHRGFETVTYLLNGRMRHKDNAGHEGVIESGGVQWMTAARGILHSEMPEQEEGLLKGFQLWVNLPASAKMGPPKYQEYPPETTPLEQREDGTKIRVIAGTTDMGTRGPVDNTLTDPTYLDVQLPPNTTFSQSLDKEYNAFLYVIEGTLSVNSTANADEADSSPLETSQKLQAKELGILDHGSQVTLRSGEQGARLLLIAGKPLKEPVARGGPFVMNTKAEILQAFNDFSSGKFH